MDYREQEIVEVEKGDFKRRKVKQTEYSRDNEGSQNVKIKGEYTLTRDVVQKKKQKIERVLPHWLMHPIYVSKNLKVKALSLEEVCPILHLDLVRKLKEHNIQYLFPVQQFVIPQILKGAHGMETRFRPRDICVATPTGSGKTLTYVLPIVQALNKNSVHSLRVLVILPVTELAKQVYKVFSVYASVFRLKVGQAFGVETFSWEQESLVERVYKDYVSKVDILIATPGRLIDHIQKTPGLDFSELRFLVLDEADKLVAEEGGEEINWIQRYLMKFKNHPINIGMPPIFPRTWGFGSLDFSVKHEDKIVCGAADGEYNIKRSKMDNNSHINNYETSSVVLSSPLQKLLFSATLSHDPEKLQNLNLYQPLLFTTDSGMVENKIAKNSIGEFTRAEELKEEWVKVDISLKPVALHYMLLQEKKRANNFKAVVFVGSIELTSKLSILLKALSDGKYTVNEFSSKFKASRDSKIRKFMKGKINVLVSSDAMARGMDVQGIDCVFSYDVPSGETYTHRIGRTARAGQLGRAISLLTDDDVPDFVKIIGNNFQNVSELTIEKKKLLQFEISYKSALENVAHAVKRRKIVSKTLKRKNRSLKKQQKSN